MGGLLDNSRDLLFCNGLRPHHAPHVWTGWLSYVQLLELEHRIAQQFLAAAATSGPNVTWWTDGRDPMNCSK